MNSTHARLATLVVLWSGLTTALLIPGRAGCSVLDDSAVRAASNHETSAQLNAADLAQLIVLYVASGVTTATATPDPDPPLPPDPNPNGDPGDPNNPNNPNNPNDPGDPSDPGDPNDPGNPTSGDPPSHHNPEPATLVSTALGAGLLLASRWRRRRPATA